MVMLKLKWWCQCAPKMRRLKCIQCRVRQYWGGNFVSGMCLGPSPSYPVGSESSLSVLNQKEFLVSQKEIVWVLDVRDLYTRQSVWICMLCFQNSFPSQYFVCVFLCVVLSDLSTAFFTQFQIRMLWCDIFVRSSRLSDRVSLYFSMCYGCTIFREKLCTISVGFDFPQHLLHDILWSSLGGAFERWTRPRGLRWHPWTLILNDLLLHLLVLLSVDRILRSLSVAPWTRINLSDLFGGSATGLDGV